MMETSGHGAMRVRGRLLGGIRQTWLILYLPATLHDLLDLDVLRRRLLER